MKLVLVMLAAAALVAVTIPDGAEASHRNKVLCGNFGGSGPSPQHKRKPNSCDVTVLRRVSDVVRLRKMKWTRWKKRAAGRGLVGGKRTTVRLKKRRRCGRFGEFKTYSKISIGGGRWQPILYCGD